MMSTAAAAPAVSLRCGSAVVREGDTVTRLRAACGAPNHAPAAIASPVPVHPIVEWTYDFGPQKLLRQVRIRNDRIIAIRTDGYGVIGTVPEACGHTSLPRGLSAYRLVYRCGAPAQRSQRLGFRPAQPGGRIDGGPQQPVVLERWRYFRGGYTLTIGLEDGRVDTIELDRRVAGTVDDADDQWLRYR